ncbi:dCTP deaminase [Bacillus thuringiensis]|uniref:dCTP deaminase n=1 Tax=Bacillus cereus TaxID=1396 RepID=A0AAN5XSF7_BACCE|nr:dCTP deaminase [Bacillus cereus]KAB2451519.1 dCTP deaminase [Bacillus cereus]KAB2489157.1 dCTP deaminase [Bacillus cereus]MDF9479482.1 dCTP deaminase [Bacillus cereus]MDF9479504.1 dCTP deaminase [Bacillus cereus]MDF9501594.1 dCTP deaminase [Bacillus cereus]
MSVLSKDEIEQYLNHSDPEKRLVITPILDSEKQFSPCTIDLRLGTTFKVDMRTREPYIDPMHAERPIDTFFDYTYRNFGEKFLVYPGQLIIASTFEYLRMPKDLFGLLATRSSWNRLGLSISSIVQPGYAGVLTLELLNNSSNPIALYPGLRFVQLSLFSIQGETHIPGYISQTASKYIANTEPSVSNILKDHDLEKLKSFV